MDDDDEQGQQWDDHDEQQWDDHDEQQWDEQGQHWDDFKEQGKHWEQGQHWDEQAQQWVDNDELPQQWDAVNKQQQLWDGVDEQGQKWDGIDETQQQGDDVKLQSPKKLKKQENKNKKLEEKRRKKQEEKRKKKLELEERRKKLEERRKKTEEAWEFKMKRSTGSPSATQLSQRVIRSPLVRSPGVNLLRSSLGALASVAASKRVRSPSMTPESSRSEKRAKSSVRSPSVPRSPSLMTSPLGGSRTIHSRGRKTCRLTSVVWKDFKPIYDCGKLVQAQCKHCDDILPGARDVGTSGVQRHLATCKTRSEVHQIVEKLKSSVSSPHASLLKQWEFDQENSRKLLARMIVFDEMPLKIVEYSGFRDFVKSLNPLFNMVSRVTIKKDCMTLYDDQRIELCEVFKKYDGRVSLTSDMWTSNQTLGYMCVTCHFIDDNWKLHKYIIRFCMLETPHDGITMFNVLLKSLQDWNIEDKLFSITLDNAAVNGAMVNHLRGNLLTKHMLHSQGELLHIRCACHVFNLIVQDGLAAMKGVIDNIRDSVKYIKSSPSQLDKFREVTAQVGISCKLPSLDVSTRWNSTFLMLESAIPFRRAFRILGKHDKHYKFSPSLKEWRRAQTLCNMLRVFNIATKAVSGSTYPTSNLYFHQVWNVKLLLEEEELKQDPVIRSMVEGMQKKFDKYWLESYLGNCIPVILDPRFKYEFIKFRLEQAFGSDATKHLVLVTGALKSLFKEYSSQMGESLNESTQGENIVEVVVEEKDPLADWDQHLSMKQRQATNELDRYLEEETFLRKDVFNILRWWDLHTLKYPVLSRIARDVLAVPASTVSSESAFSTGERVVSDYRSRLSSKTVEALVCLQDWLRAAGPSTRADLGDDDPYYY